MKLFVILLSCLVLSTTGFAQQAYHDQYRPQIHFSPKEHWTNDPNGMVYYNGTPLSSFYQSKKDDKVLRFCFAKKRNIKGGCREAK